MDEDEKAMAAVIDDMGRAARHFKAKKYAPKKAVEPTPAPAATETQPEVSAADLEAMLNGG